MTIEMANRRICAPCRTRGAVAIGRMPGVTTDVFSLGRGGPRLGDGGRPTWNDTRNSATADVVKEVSEARTLGSQPVPPWSPIYLPEQA
jgi:hypothetical protein